MRTASLRRKTVVFLLIAVFAVPLASTAGPRNESSGPATAVALSPLELLGHLWSFLRGAWNKEGCRIDPDGQCTTGASQPPVQTKEGCHIDPDGRCATGTSQPPVQTKTGCEIDPSGRCIP